MPSLLMPCSAHSFLQNSLPTWFPHCPTCKQMISRGILLLLLLLYFPNARWGWRYLPEIWAT